MKQVKETIDLTAVEVPLPNINTFISNVFNKLDNMNFKLHVDVANSYTMSLMFETLNIDLGESLLEKDSRILDVNLAMFDCSGLDFNDVDFNEFVKAALDNELSINVECLLYLDVGLVEEIVIYKGDDPKDAEQSIFIEKLCK